jgi:hypothetical protein
LEKAAIASFSRPILLSNNPFAPQASALFGSNLLPLLLLIGLLGISYYD